MTATVLTASDVEDNGRLQHKRRRGAELSTCRRTTKPLTTMAPGDNEYNIVVQWPPTGRLDQSTTEDPIQMGYKKVVIEVTDEDEPGVITLSIVAAPG